MAPYGPAPALCAAPASKMAAPPRAPHVTVPVTPSSAAAAATTTTTTATAVSAAAGARARSPMVPRAALCPRKRCSPPRPALPPLPAPPACHGSPGLLPLAQPQVPLHHRQLRGGEGEAGRPSPPSSPRAPCPGPGPLSRVWARESEGRSGAFEEELGWPS